LTKSVTPELKIRPVRQSDLSFVHVIDQAAFGAIANDFVTIRQMYDIATDCFFVGEADSQIVGYAVGCVKFASDSGWLLDVAVLPGKHGLGYGSSLAKVVIETLASAGVSTVRLVVQPQNGAVRLYEKLGFTEESRDADYYGTGERIVMIAKVNLGAE
jgi:ribosomal-protein-alanine N-acetyltransferase